MENSETLKQYLTYTNDIEEVKSICGDLFAQLKVYHSKGYYIPNINSNSIVMTENKYYSNDGYSKFTFLDIAPMSSEREKTKKENIIDLCKLTIGAYVSSSIENSFIDYTGLKTKYIKDMFGELEPFLPDLDYFRKTIDESEVTYYSDYLSDKYGSNINKKGSNVYQKSTSVGRLYTKEEEAAYINSTFVLTLLLIIMIVIIVAMLLIL